MYMANYISVSVCLYVSASLSVSVCLCVCLSVCLSLSPPLSLSFPSIIISQTNQSVNDGVILMVQRCNVRQSTSSVGSSKGS